VYACGSNVLGQLGTGRTDQSLPVCIESLTSTKVTSISCGEMCSAAVSGACDQHSFFFFCIFVFGSFALTKARAGRSSRRGVGVGIRKRRVRLYGGTVR
jgi:hypothetical protein